MINNELNRVIDERDDANALICELRKALQGMLDWYEDTYGEGFCECDRSVDLTCRACVARGLLPGEKPGVCFSCKERIPNSEGNICAFCAHHAAQFD